MAGKRQHYVPQFLQRGFLTRTSRKEEFTCVYRANGECFPANIKKVGVEGFFYSTPESDADGAITESENEFSELVEELRKRSGAVRGEGERLASLLAHLEVRSRHLRQSFLKTGTHLADFLLGAASDPWMFEPYLRRILRDQPSLLREALAEGMKKYGVSEAHLPKLMEIAVPLAEAAVPRIAAQMSVLAPQIRAELPARFEQAAKSGHVRGLVHQVAPAKKAALLSELRFRVCRFPEPSLVLGDSMVVFQVSGSRTFKPFIEKNDRLEAAILPVAADAALIGERDSYAVDTDVLRLETARCSLEFFIASEECASNAQLSCRIGESAHLLTQAEAEQLVRALFEP